MYYVIYDKHDNIIGYTSGDKKTAKFFKKARRKKASIVKEDYVDTSRYRNLEIITEYVHTDGIDMLMPMTIDEYNKFRYIFDIMSDDIIWVKQLLDMPIKKKYKKSIRRLINHIEAMEGRLDTFNLFVNICENYDK